MSAAVICVNTDECPLWMFALSTKQLICSKSVFSANPAVCWDGFLVTLRLHQVFCGEVITLMMVIIVIELQRVSGGSRTRSSSHLAPPPLHPHSILLLFTVAAECVCSVETQEGREGWEMMCVERK